MQSVWTRVSLRSLLDFMGQGHSLLCGNQTQLFFMQTIKELVLLLVGPQPVSCCKVDRAAFVLQVDYESEDEDESDDNEDKEEGETQENPESVEESQPEPAPVIVETKKKEPSEESLVQTRVNSVLQINSAVEKYSFDHEQELWCEVSI